MTKILFLVPYPLKESPSQRFRFEQYFDILRNNGYKVEVQSFFSSAEWTLYYQKGSSMHKLFALLKGYIKRIGILVKVPAFHFIFIHREVTPVGPPLFEWLIAKAFRKKIVYDFDDAIWLTDKINEAWSTKLLRWRTKTASICQWGYKTSCGNTYLADYASLFNPQTIVNPTTIDTERLHNRNLYILKEINNTEELIIGWTGSHSTLKYLKLIEDSLQQLEHLFPIVKFLVIADQKPDLQLNNLEFCRWRIESEISDLMKIDIGIMPLPDDEWAKGKCGFKALQYMALEIPTAVSAVGVNTSIVDHGVNGFICTSPQEWVQCLSSLIENKSLREQMGKRGRQKVIDQFSVHSNRDNFLSLFS